MAASFTVACSNCSAKLKLKDRSKIGKKVRCPKCSEPFVIQDPATAGDDGGFFDEQEDEWGNDFDDLGDDFDDDFAPAPRKKKSKNSKKGSKKKGKKRGKSQSGTSAGLIAALVGGGVFFLALIAAGVYFLLPILLGTGTANRMQWLPNDTQTYVEIRVADIWESNVLKPIRTSKLGLELKKQLTEVGELNIEDIEKIVVGMPANSKKPIVILYAKVKIDPSKLITPGTTTSSYAGYKIYEDASGQSVRFFANIKTMVAGPKDLIHAAIDRKGECAVADDFDFVPTRGGIVFGSLSPGRAMQQSPAGMMTRGSFETEKMKSIAGAIEFTSDLNISLTMTYEDTTSAQAALTQAQEQLDKQKEQQKQQSAGSASSGQSGPAQSMQEGAQKVMDSVKLSGSGDQFSTKLTVPGSFVEDGVKMLEQFGGGRGLIPGL